MIVPTTTMSGRRVSPFPLEVLTRIASYLTPGSELVFFARVNWTFYTASKPLLYRHIRVGPYGLGYWSPKSVPIQVPSCVRDRLAANIALVRCVDVSFYYPLHMRPKPDALHKPNPYSYVLPAMPNGRTLRVLRIWLHVTSTKKQTVPFIHVTANLRPRVMVLRNASIMPTGVLLARHSPEHYFHQQAFSSLEHYVAVLHPQEDMAAFFSDTPRDGGALKVLTAGVRWLLTLPGSVGHVTLVFYSWDPKDRWEKQDFGNLGQGRARRNSSTHHKNATDSSPDKNGQTTHKDSSRATRITSVWFDAVFRRLATWFAAASKKGTTLTIVNAGAISPAELCMSHHATRVMVQNRVKEYFAVFLDEARSESKGGSLKPYTTSNKPAPRPHPSGHTPYVMDSPPPPTPRRGDEHAYPRFISMTDYLRGDEWTDVFDPEEVGSWMPVLNRASN